MREIDEILESGLLSGFRGTPEGQLGGKHVQKLEEAFRDYFNVKYAIAMNSATACLHASLIACGVGVGDEVIVSPYTFSSSVSCVLMVGAKPIFVDIEDETFCIDLDKVKEAITPKTKAIIPVHLMGHPMAMASVDFLSRIYNLRVIEDAAQAIGAKVGRNYAGAFGDCGVFSFNQSKQISTGEGGLLITNDDKIARIARAVRNHGEVSDPELKILGYNYRMCEIEACLAYRQFQALPEQLEYRNKLAEYMTLRLGEFDGFIPPVIKGWATHAFYTYAVKFDASKTGMSRDKFQDEMIKRGVYFGKGYVKPLYLLPIYGYEEGLCPVAERMWHELMVFDWLKYPTTFKDIDHAIEIIKEILKGGSSV